MTQRQSQRAKGLISVFMTAVIMLGLSAMSEAADKKKKNKFNDGGDLTDLKMKAGDEKGNDMKALQAEILIASQEERAIEQIQKLLKKYRGTQLEADLQLRLGELYMRRSKTDRFLEVHRSSEEIVNIAPKLVKNAGSKEQIRKAIQIYDLIEQKFPNFDRFDMVLLNNAFANQQIGNEDKAEKKFLRLVREFSASEYLPDAHLALGEMKFGQRNFKMALEHFEAVRKFPDSTVYPYGIYKAAWTQYNLRDVDAAIKNLEDVIRYGRFVKDQGIDQRLDLRKEAMFDLALFFEDNRPSKEAFAYFTEQARELDVSPVIMRLSELYKRHSRYADTRIVLSDLIKRLPTSALVPEAYVELMEASDKMKKQPDVITLLENFKDVCVANSKWAKAQVLEEVATAPVEAKPASPGAKPDMKTPVQLVLKPYQVCRETFNRMALGYANKWLKIWQNDNTQKVLVTSAESAFEIYLRDDPKTEESSKARFVYAEVQFKLDKFRSASDNYAMVAQSTIDKKMGHDARYYAIASLEKAVKDKWSDKDEARFRFLARDYLTKEPNAKYALEIEFKGAFIAYEKGRYDEAAPTFKKLGALYAKDDKGLKSQDLYLDILNLKKDYLNLRDYSADLRVKAIGERAEKLTKIYEESYFLIIQKFEEKEKWDEAIAEYTNFSKLNPKSPLTQKALWNITQLYFKMGDLMAGADSALVYYEKYKDTKEGLDSLMKAAQTYEALGQLKQAANTLVTLSTVDKSSKSKWLALAADFYVLSNEYTKAKPIYEDLRKAGDSQLKNRALAQLEQISRKDNDVKKRESLLREIMNLGLQPQASHAAIHFADKVFAAGQFEEAFNLAKNILSQEKSGAAKSALARARFMQAKIIADEFKRQSVNAKIERIQTVLTLKTEKLSKAQVAFQSAANYGDPNISVQALYELSQCYLQYSNALHDMAMPKGLPEEEIQAFKAEMDKLAIPMEEKGIETLVQAYSLARGLGLPESVSKELQVAMKKMNQPVVDVATTVKLQAAPINVPAENTTAGATQNVESANLAYVSLARNTPFSSSDCPASNKSWRGENARKLVNYANGCVRAQNHERLEQIADVIAQKFSKLPWGPYYLSLAAEMRKEMARGIWMIELALKREPTNATLTYQKARLHWALDEYPVAVQAFQKALEQNNSLLDAHLFLGQLFYRDHEFKKSASEFEKSRTLMPENIEATIGLAESYIAMNQADKAIALYEDAVNLAPRKTSFRYKLGQLYESIQKDQAHALATYKRVRDLTAESRAPAEEIPADLNDRIQRLETSLAAQAKVLSQESAKEKTKQVKK